MEGESQTRESSSDEEEDTKDEGNDEDTNTHWCNTSLNHPSESKVKVKNLQKIQMMRKMKKKTMMMETLSSIRLRETRRYLPKIEDYLPKSTKMAVKTNLTCFRSRLTRLSSSKMGAKIVSYRITIVQVNDKV